MVLNALFLPLAKVEGILLYYINIFHFDSNEVIFLHFTPLVQHIESMMVNHEFSQDTKTLYKCPQYKAYLTHRNLVATMKSLGQG